MDAIISDVKQSSTAFWSAVFLLAGTTIGAGIFAIPFATQQAGYLSGVFWLICFAVVTLGINIAYGYVVINSKLTKLHQFVGYAEERLGTGGKFVAVLVLLLGQWGAVLAYLIGIGLFIEVIIGSAGLEMVYAILVFLVVAVAVWFQIRFVASFETWLTLGMFVVIGLIIISGYPYVKFENVGSFHLVVNQASFLLTYGVFMSALTGFSVIPEMVALLQLGSSKKSRTSFQTLLKPIIVGTLIPVIIYLVFQFVVVGISGVQTTEEAIQGLVPFLDVGIVRLGAVFGVMAMVSSYISLTYVLKDTFLHDFNLSKIRGWGLALFPPLILYLSGFRSFARVLDLTGVWLGTTSIILISLMLLRLQKRRRA